MKKDKFLYILSIIMYALAGIGGVSTIVGFILQNTAPKTASIMQITGVILVLVGYGSATLIDLLWKRKRK